MVVNGIDSKDISVVIQGPIRSVTGRCLASLRSALPGAELILSTWEGMDGSGLDCDKQIFSRDPGNLISDDISGLQNNLNRQIVSTQAGLREAARPYVLKTRTDILFHSPDFLTYFGVYDKARSVYFRNRLLICSYYTRNPRVGPLCFHPSDWIVFGRREDIREYYNDLPLMPAEEGEWFRSHLKQRTIYTNYICRYTPEQYIFLNYLKKRQEIKCACYYDRTAELIEQTERAFAECFVVLDYQKQLPITFTRYKPNRYMDRHSLITHRQWRALYRRYCLKETGIGWAFYLFCSFLRRSIALIRMRCVLLLDDLHLKEAVKSIMARN